MLGNNEKIQGVNLADVFGRMLGEIPWTSLKNYVFASAPLMKLCTMGGHRLEPQKRDRIEKLIQREAQKPNMAEQMNNGVFACWYPVHTELHTNLEDYFHSTEYKEYRESKGLGEDEYVLPDEKFEAFFKVEDLPKWRILLCFSPLKFTAEQAAKILDDNSGNVDLVERLKGAETERDELSKKNAQLNGELERLRNRQNEMTNEIQELKKLNRQLRADNDSRQEKQDSLLAELRRANAQLTKFDSQKQDEQVALKEEMQRTRNRMQSDIDRLGKELASWQSRYEEQRQANRSLGEQTAEAGRKVEQIRKEKEGVEKRNGELEKFADLLLSRIDWARVGTAMKMTPTVRRNFNSMIKRLNYEEDRSLKIEGTLPDFWSTLQKSENALIDGIVKSESQEMMNGSADDYWEGLKELFPDVIMTLEARIAMLNILQEIFYQTFSDESLEEPLLVSGKPKAKAAKE